MKVLVKFDVDADIIDCPQSVIENLPEYGVLFLDWLFDKRNDHSYWMYKDNEKLGCSYRSEALVEWLNRFVLNDSIQKALVVESVIYKWDGNLPIICF